MKLEDMSLEERVEMLERAVWALLQEEYDRNAGGRWGEVWHEIKSSYAENEEARLPTQE